MALDLDLLNPQQRAAVEALDGPVLIVAGAGSGKTRVITARVIHLLERGVPPYRILAVTFTNKAASEMRQRVRQELDVPANELTISTFHGFCARFLRREISALGRSGDFAILDSSDQQACIKRVLKDMKLNEKDYSPQHLRSVFSFVRNTGGPDSEPENQRHAEIFRAYRRSLEAQNAVDFDELMLLTCRILEEHDEVRERYRDRFKYVMVDEYQDTNRVQFRLIQLLVNPAHNNICVVGDEDQSIYGWRGADIRNILDFEENFKRARVFKLEQNYRSTQNILNFANKVIAENSSRKEKALWTEQGEGERVRLKVLPNNMAEAEFIANRVSDLHEAGVSRGEIAVLFRANHLSRSVEDILRRYRVPYQLIGGLKFYDRKEIKDILAYLRLLANPRDWTSFTRAVAVPKRGVGAKAQETLYALFQDNYTVPELLEKAVRDKLVRGKGLSGIKEFLELYRHLEGMKDANLPSTVTEALLMRLDYIALLEREDVHSADYRADNVNELLAGIGEMESRGLNSLEELMDFAALASDQDEIDDDEPKVSLMTVHSAKGLEFEYVFVIGLEEKIFPNARALADNVDGLEEERRLFYVAVTRAKKQLFLSCCKRRFTFGTMQPYDPSRFLSKLDPGIAAFARSGMVAQPYGKRKSFRKDDDFELDREKQRLGEQLQRLKGPVEGLDFDNKSDS